MKGFRTGKLGYSSRMPTSIRFRETVPFRLEFRLCPITSLQFLFSACTHCIHFEELINFVQVLFYSPPPLFSREARLSSHFDANIWGMQEKQCC